MILAYIRISGAEMMDYNQLEATLIELDRVPLSPSMQLAVAQVRLLIDIAEVQRRQEALLERLLSVWKVERKAEAMKKKAEKPTMGKMKKCPACGKEYKGEKCPCGGKKGGKPTAPARQKGGWRDSAALA